MNNRRFDIVVAGGGPAGCITAWRMQQMGYSVVLIERSREPDQGRLESLSQGAMQLLDSLGVWAGRFETVCVRPRESWINWSSGPDFLPRDPAQSGWIIRRDGFDRMLREWVNESGVTMLPETRAVSAVRTGNHWKISLGGVGAGGFLVADFLVDACGKQSIIHGKKSAATAKTLAISGLTLGPSGRDASTWLESRTDHWTWTAILPDGMVSTQLFLDPHMIPRADRQRLVEFYFRKVCQSVPLGRIWRGRELIRLHAREIQSGVRADPAGADWICVGDSSFSLDPICSQGIQSAIAGALQASVVANTVICRPASREMAIAFYRDRQREALARHKRFVARVYSEGRDAYPDSPFWQARAAMPGEETRVGQAPRPIPPPETRIRFAHTSRLVSEPCLIGDHVVAQQTFNHPLLDRPLAFWDGVAACHLFCNLDGYYTASNLVETWSERLPQPRARELFVWLWGKGVIVGPEDC